LTTRTIDLGLLVMDHQLLDSEGRRCGNVDELALEGNPGEPLEVVAILSGPGTWRRRAGRLGRFASWIGGGHTVRIPWEEVEALASHVKLRKRAEALGLGRGDDRLRPYIEKIPGADR
jgi:sporulation protein YlmC with PRC-barrel domain